MKEELNAARSPPLASSPVDINHLDIASIVEYIKRLQAHIIFNDNQLSANRMPPKRRQSLHMLIATEIIYKTIRTLLRKEQEIDSSLDKDSLIQRLELPVGDDKTLEKVNIEEIKKDLAERLSGFVKLLRLSEQLMTNFRQNELIDRNFTESRRILEEYATASEENARLLTDKIEKLSGDNITLVKKVDEQGQKLDEQGQKLDELINAIAALKNKVSELEKEKEINRKQIGELLQKIVKLEQELEKIKEIAEIATEKSEIAIKENLSERMGRENKKDCLPGCIRGLLVGHKESAEEYIKKIKEKGAVSLHTLYIIFKKEIEIKLLGIWKISPEGLKRLLKEGKEVAVFLMGKDGVSHIIRLRKLFKKPNGDLLVLKRESNYYQEFNAEDVYLSELLPRLAQKDGKIIIVAKSEDEKAIKDHQGGEEITEKEAEELSKEIEDILGVGNADGGGTPDGGGSTGQDGGGGGATAGVGSNGGGATVPAGSSPLGRGAGTDDIPRNTPAKAMDTRLPKNNGVITITGNDIGKGNDGQASSAATPDNILNLNLPSEQYGINYKGIASSPVTNTGTGAAPPGEAINALSASLNTPTSEEAHTLAAVSSGINSQPVSEPTGDDNDSSASVFQQQTPGIKGSRFKY